MTSKLSFLVIALSILNVSGNSPRRRQGQHRKNYDSLKLSVNWSPTVCGSLVNNGPEATCSLCKSTKAVNKWTIHGLWPSGGGPGFDPSECSNIKFNSTQLSDELKSQLRLKWPSLKSYNDEIFWAHEWKKHGTCASNVNGTSGYFSKTLQLYDRYDVGNALSDAEIIPGANYRLEDVQSALKKSFGGNVFVACYRVKGIKRPIFSEIRLCFDKSFELIDCGIGKRHLSNCYSRKLVTYPGSC